LTIDTFPAPPPCNSVPRIQNLATHPLKRLHIASHNMIATRSRDSSDIGIPQRQRIFSRSEFTPDCRRAQIEIQDAVVPRQIVRESPDFFAVHMIWRQSMITVPYLGHSNRGNEKMSSILRIAPADQSAVGLRFPRLAHCVRVQHEIHGKRGGGTNSSEARGGSQFTFPRTESSQALSAFIRWARVPRFHHGLRRAFAAFFAAFPFACFPSSQPNNSLASRADNFFTLLTASSTALIRPNLRGNALADNF